MSRPLAIDLYAGLGGWTEGLLAEGYDVVGFDIERHVYGEMGYPAQLVIQDVRTLHGSQFRDADLIVASPPCQEYSYMAMPWSRAKQIERALRGEGEFPEGYKGSRTVDELNALFDACFRIQREACEAAGRHIPMVVENVCGAQKWVGPAMWRHGSYYLWGDVPALMPMVAKAKPKVGGLDWSKYGDPDYKSSGAAGCFRDSALKNPGFRFDGSGKSFQSESVNTHIKNSGGSWFRVAHNTTSGKGQNPDGRRIERNDPRDHTPHMTNPAEHIKCGGDWFNGKEPSQMRHYASGSTKRKMASAMIAKIPFELSRHVAAVYKPEST